jgi:hypothetical protein
VVLPPPPSRSSAVVDNGAGGRNAGGVGWVFAVGGFRLAATLFVEPKALVIGGGDPNGRVSALALF